MQRSCKNCSTSFEVTPDDLVFYDKVSPIFQGKKYPIPSPTLCPKFRMQRRLTFRNERSFYRRTCDRCRKEMVSIYAPNALYTVYCQDCWWSDHWDAAEWGMEVDFSRSFFEQLGELWRRVPLIGLWTISCENAEYNSNCFELKDSYLCINSDRGRDNYYSYCAEYCANVIDCTSVYRCELCYSCVDAANAYHCFFSGRLEDCSDCFFSSDLVGCKYCFGCHGLRHKEYVLWNAEVTPEEWNEKVRSLSLTPEVVMDSWKRSEEVRLRVPHRAVRQMKCENCIGSSLYQCKNVWNSFDIIDSEDLKYVIYAAWNARNVQDAYALGDVEWAYEYISGGGGVSHVAFVQNSFNGLSDSMCTNLCGGGSRDLFGCIGLKRKEYCILNRQYRRDEYEEIVPRIIEHMRRGGEFGEYFPISLSPFCYNETKAQEFCPLSKEEALHQGFRWRDSDPREYQKQTFMIPEDIQDIPDTIGEEILACTSCGRNYRIIPQELRFYRQERIGIPRLCPDCRHRVRLERRNPFRLFDRTCGKCGKSMKSTYSPERPEIVYCESCYLSTVY